MNSKENSEPLVVVRQSDITALRVMQYVYHKKKVSVQGIATDLGLNIKTAHRYCVRLRQTCMHGLFDVTKQRTSSGSWRYFYSPQKTRENEFSKADKLLRDFDETSKKIIRFIDFLRDKTGAPQ